MMDLSRKSFVAVCAVVLLASASFSACTDHVQRKHHQVFRLNFSSGTLESLDPAFAKDLYVLWASHMIYNTLVETDDSQHIVSSLARQWRTSADGLTYTFWLRNDVYFQDNPLFRGGRGRKMTASDVAYSLSRLINPRLASPGAWIFNGKVNGSGAFQALNDSVFQIRLVKPFRPLLQMLTMQYCAVVPQEVADHWKQDFRSHPCGTGPFSFHYWDEGNILVLHKNKHYWERDGNGARLPYLDAVTISFVDSKATEFLLFLQHKIDFVNGIDGSFKDLVLTKGGDLKAAFRNQFKVLRGTYLNTEYIGLLTDSATSDGKKNDLHNVLVRRALNFAIDRKKVVTYFKNNCGTAATAGFIPAGLGGYGGSKREVYSYDPEQAARLLAMAGHTRGNGLAAITVLTPDNYADIVNFVVTQWQQLGIRASLEIMQPNILRQQMSRSQAIAFRAQWLADYPDAETYMACFYSKYPAPPNYSRFSNATFDHWYEQSLNMPDSVRPAFYQRMDSLAMASAPIVPLYYDERLHFLSNNFSGFSSNVLNIISLKTVRAANN